MDKPQGCTSHDVLSMLKKKWLWERVGHCGTLDPMATGLLVVLVGSATKLSSHLSSFEKSYDVELQFGLTTDTWDITGEIQKETLPSENLKPHFFELIKNWSENLCDFEVPLYSATKKNGQPLYKYARKGCFIEPIYKPMKFYDIQIQKVSWPKVKLSVSCSKGGYIRSFVQFLGQNLEKVGATMTALRRTACAPWPLEKAQKLQDILQASQTPELISVQSLPWPHRLFVSNQERNRFSNGLLSYSLLQRLRPLQLDLEQDLQKKEDLVALYCSRGQMRGLLRLSSFSKPKTEAVFG